MLSLFKHKRDRKLPTGEPNNKSVIDPGCEDGKLLYSKKAIIDCTNFSATSPDEPLGYMCGGNVSLSTDGTLRIRPDDPDDEVESFSVLDIVRARDNINGYDPEHQNDVSIMTAEKHFMITFSSAEDKKSFWDVLTVTYDATKKQ